LEDYAAAVDAFCHNQYGHQDHRRLKLFDVILALTGGGPGNASQSMSTFMYDLYFKRQDAGYAAAQGVFMAALILADQLYGSYLF
jgi:hypothetical protein